MKEIEKDSGRDKRRKRKIANSVRESWIRDSKKFLVKKKVINYDRRGLRVYILKGGPYKIRDCLRKPCLIFQPEKRYKAAFH